MLMTQAIRRAAQVNPIGLALVDAETQLTWPQFVNRVARVAQGLRRCGLQKGDRVAILGLNSVSYLESLHAIWWAGCIAVPLNIRWSHSENTYAMKDSGALGLIADDEHFPAAMKLANSGLPLRALIALQECSDENWVSFQALRVGDPMPADEVPMDEVAGIYYTGGTTGFPKGVMLSPMAMWSSSMSLALELGLGQNVRFLHAAPMFHIADSGISFAVTIVGGAHVFIPRFEPAAFVQCVNDHLVTNAMLVPTMIRMLLDHLAQTPAKLSTLEGIVYGGSSITEATIREALSRLPNCRLSQSYGQTELAPMASYLASEYHEPSSAGSILRSAGRATYCVELKVANDEGQEHLRGEVGELWVRGPNVMLGYWNKAEQTTQALVDGWVRTGDAAVMSEDGFVTICDRIKDMIVTGGENVFSAEVENAVASHPDVTVVSVIAVPDAALGERVHAVIIPAAGKSLTLEDIQAHCRSEIAGYKIPRSVEFRNEPLPINAAGKVLKTELREPHWADVDRGVA
jgi:long-chain acyl-CoA synthetase